LASHFHKCSVPLFPLSLFLFIAGENERKNRSFCGPSNIQSIESTLLVSKRLFSWTYHYCTIHWYLHIPTQIRSSPCFIKVTKTWDNQNKKKLKQQCWVFFFFKNQIGFWPSREFFIGHPESAVEFNEWGEQNNMPPAKSDYKNGEQNQYLRTMMWEKMIEASNARWTVAFVHFVKKPSLIFQRDMYNKTKM